MPASPKVAEKNLWKWLRQADLEGLVMERVENMLDKGFPDVDGVLDGRAFKLELKTCSRPARETTPLRVKFQPGQTNWIRRFSKAGGNVAVLLQVGADVDRIMYLIRDAGTLARLAAGEVLEQELEPCMQGVGRRASPRAIVSSMVSD